MATNKLKNTLVKLGIKQSELARECNLSEGTISKVCNEKRTPAPTTMNKIVRALNKLGDANYRVTEIFSSYPDGDDEEED